MNFADTVALTAKRLDLDLFRSAKDRIDPAWIQEALERGECVGMRRRKLPADVVVWLVIAVCLLAHKSFADVVRTMGVTVPTRRGNAQAPPSSGAVAEARKRVGSGAMCELFRISGKHWVHSEDFAHLRFHGLQVLAADGFTARTPDTATNREEFGKPASTGEETAYPQLRALCVFDVATHFIVDAVLGPYSAAEVPLFEEATPRLPPHSVCILDRNFNAFGVLYRIHLRGEERHWLVRAKGQLAAKAVESLGPGDTLVRVELSHQARRADPSLPREFTARRIDYQIDGKDFILLTSMLDAVRFPAAEVGSLYHSRWDSELVIDDLKTELRGASLTLRSKTPEGIYQELYGVLIAHNVVRVEMARAAVMLKVPPTRISFHKALILICHHVEGMAYTSAPSKLTDRELELRSALQFLLLPERRTERHYPRALKIIIGRYPKKRIVEPQDSS
jgi:hypothetical protein